MNELKELAAKCDALKSELKRLLEEAKEAEPAYKRAKAHWDKIQVEIKRTEQHLKVAQTEHDQMMCLSRWKRLMRDEQQWSDFYKRYQGTELARTKKVKLPSDDLYPEYNDYMHLSEEDLKKILTFALENGFRTWSDPETQHLDSVEFRRTVRCDSWSGGDRDPPRSDWHQVHDFQDRWDAFLKTVFELPKVQIGIGWERNYMIHLFRSHYLSAQDNMTNIIRARKLKK